LLKASALGDPTLILIDWFPLGWIKGKFLRSLGHRITRSRITNQRAAGWLESRIGIISRPAWTRRQLCSSSCKKAWSLSRRRQHG